MEGLAVPLTASRAPRRAATWLLLRRALLLTLVLGFGISIFGSGRFTMRLIVDGALSFAFVPVCELAGFAVVYRTGRRTLPFAEAVDRYFAGNTPWLWWMFGIMVDAPDRRMAIPS